MSNWLSRQYVLHKLRAVLPDEHEDLPGDPLLMLRLSGNELSRHHEMQGALAGDDVGLHRGRLLHGQRLRLGEPILRYAGHGDMQTTAVQ